MANAKIYSFADALSVNSSQIQVPQNVRLVFIENEEEQGNNLAYRAPVQKNGGQIDDKVVALANATAYIIIVDTKIGDEPGDDFPISFGGIKPRAMAAVDAGAYSAYKLNLSSTQLIHADKIPLDLTASGTLQELDISNPGNPVVNPVS